MWYFEDIGSLEENWNSSVNIFGFIPVKSVGGRDNIGYAKRKLAEICDAAKGETWESIEYRQSQIFKKLSYIYLYLFLKWQSFPQTSRI